jgi:GT2 family glycosyltransferase
VGLHCGCKLRSDSLSGQSNDSFSLLFSHMTPSISQPEKVSNGICLSVVIVSYRSMGVLRGCLNSLYGTSRANCLDVVVVDNASNDGTSDVISTEYPRVTLIENRMNVGFPAATNQGIAAARAGLILLLNPDTIVDEAALDKVIECFERDSRDKIVGLNIRNVDGTAQDTVHLKRPGAMEFVVQQSGLAFRSQANWDRDSAYGAGVLSDSTVVGWVSGAAVALTRRVVDRIGALDAGMFWAEDLDFCARAADAGIPIYYLHAASVIHYGGESGKKNFRKMIFHQHVSRVAFARKHYGVRYELLMRAVYAITLPGKIALRAAQMTIPGRAMECRSRLAGYFDAFLFCVSPAGAGAPQK